MNLFNLPTTEEAVIKFLRDKRVLPSDRVCSNGYKAKLYFNERVFWKCNVKECQKKVNMHVGNWFVGTRLPFVTAARFSTAGPMR